MKSILIAVAAVFISGPVLADSDSTYGGTFRAPGVTNGDGTNVTIELVGGNALIYCVEFPNQTKPNCFENAHIPYTGSPDAKFTFSAPNFGKWEFERISDNQINVLFTHENGNTNFANLIRGVTYSDIPN